MKQALGNWNGATWYRMPRRLALGEIAKEIGTSWATNRPRKLCMAFTYVKENSGVKYVDVNLIGFYMFECV